MSANADIDARIDFNREHRAPEDIDLEPVVSEDEDYESSPPQYDILTYPADFTLEVLHQKWKNKEILIPEFQRGFVWKQVQASKLIESFLVGLPVPSVFLYSERKTRHFLVIDGQQRLKSIFFFFEGYFGAEEQGRRRVFRLTGLDSKSRFHGKTFEDLAEEDQRGFKDQVLRAFIVKQVDPEDDTSMYHIFERLNTGGTLLANQEIRNCVYHGPFVDLIMRLNSVPAWRKILGKTVPDSGKRDLELVVRFLALRDISAYEKPMKDYLSRFMNKNRNPSEEVVAETERRFREICEVVVSSLGEEPFHVRGGLNVAVLDAVMIAFSENPEMVPEDIEQRYARLLEDKDFKDNTLSGTTDKSAIKTRFRRAREVLFG
ncbi:MAG: DUF262 domain-containing protein [Thermodesulfobacteriota bacterium]